jgi:opacity protein-like surface antigen
MTRRALLAAASALALASCEPAPDVQLVAYACHDASGPVYLSERAEAPDCPEVGPRGDPRPDYERCLDRAIRADWRGDYAEASAWYGAADAAKAGQPCPSWVRF